MIIQIKLYRTKNKHKKSLMYSYKKGSYLISCEIFFLLKFQQVNSVCQIFIFYTHFLENHSIFLNVDCVYLYWKKNKNKKPFKVPNFWLSRNYLFIARVLISVMIYAVLLFYGIFSTN